MSNFDDFQQRYAQNRRPPRLPPIRTLAATPIFPAPLPAPRQRIILPPPIATITHPNHALSAQSIFLPRLRSMASSGSSDAMLVAPILDPSSVQPQYYAQGQPLQSQQQSAASGQHIAGGLTRSQAREVKRRTKTGCLTCRTRRIKCDEAKPICRNCQKSKRDCQGYDTAVFKDPQKPPIVPATAMTDDYINYRNLDPELKDYINTEGIMPGALIPGQHNPNAQGPQTTPPLSIEEVLNSNGYALPQIPSSPSSLSQEQIETLKANYEQLYAMGLDKFFETRWFTNRGFEHLLNNSALVNKYLVLISRFIYGDDQPLEYHPTVTLECHVIWETALLARQVSLAISTTNDPEGNDETKEGVQEAAKRIAVFEALVTNSKLDPINAIAEPTASDFANLANALPLDLQIAKRQRRFWHATSTFCSLRDDTKYFTENPVNDINEALTRMRRLLESRENRDVIYSIAVARHTGQGVAEKSLDDSSSTQLIMEDGPPATHVRVAIKFLSDHSAKVATYHVAKRMSWMAVSSWSKRMN